MSRPARLNSRRRRVLVVTIRSPSPIRAVQRARLWAITWIASQAPLAANLPAPGWRERFSAPLAIDHPRIPFPQSEAAFDAMRALGDELGRAHLMEALVGPDVRLEGDGPGVIESPRHDEVTETVWINARQRFTGVPSDAWVWGGAFRPLEHFLVDRRGRRLDADQIAMFQSAIWAVRESIRLGPLLDDALGMILEATMDVTI